MRFGAVLKIPMHASRVHDRLTRQSLAYAPQGLSGASTGVVHKVQFGSSSQIATFQHQRRTQTTLVATHVGTQPVQTLPCQKLRSCGSPSPTQQTRFNLIGLCLRPNMLPIQYLATGPKEAVPMVTLPRVRVFP